MSSSSAPKGAAPFGPLPIVIGVTGHRDLRSEDIPRLEEHISDIFARLRSEYPHTPVELLSPLAEGADRLVARVALRHGVRLTVPLPMPQEMYENDFGTEESLAEFRALLASATACIELPLSDRFGPDQAKVDGPARDYQYGVLGAYIVRNSHALIALWNGVLPERSNGTADVVSFNLHGVPEEFAPSRSLLEPQESDPVWHIVTPRAGNPETVGEPLTLHLLYPSRFESPETGRKKFRAVLECTERFNRDETEYRGKLSEARRKSRGYLIDESLPAVEALSLKPTLNLFATADTLAEHFASHTHSTLKKLFLTVTAAAVIFDIYTHIYITVWSLLAVYLLLLVITYGLVLRSRRRTFQSRYLDYRALAEGLRVRFFWSLVGINDEIADHYLHKQRSELDWIRYALRVWNPDIRSEGKMGATSREAGDGVTANERLLAAHRFWVDDQRKYFVRAAEREERYVKKAELWAGGMIVAGIALAFFQVLHQGVFHPHPGKHPIHWLLVAVALAPIIAGLLLGYVEKRAHGDHAKQYERMSILFDNASEQLKELIATNNVGRAHRLLLELGREALAENGDWVLIHRDRPIEVPKA